MIRVISLTNEVQRRKHILDTFTNLDIEFEFFDAVDKQVALDICYQEGLIYYEDNITLGELGCFMSHYLLWQQIVNHNLPYMMIFEDDVIVSKNIKRFLQNIEKIMANFQAIHLETIMMQSVYEEKIEVEGFDFQKLLSCHMGLAGYVITRDMAKKLIQRIKIEDAIKPVDHYLCKDVVEQDNNSMYQINPALVIQEDVLNRNTNRITLHSSLEEERKKRRRKVAKNKVSREFKRLLSQLKPEYWRLKRREKYIKKNGIIIPFDNQSLTKDVTQ